MRSDRLRCNRRISGISDVCSLIRPGWLRTCGSTIRNDPESTLSAPAFLSPSGIAGFGQCRRRRHRRRLHIGDGKRYAPPTYESSSNQRRDTSGALAKNSSSSAGSDCATARAQVRARATLPTRQASSSVSTSSPWGARSSNAPGTRRGFDELGCFRLVARLSLRVARRSGRLRPSGRPRTGSRARRRRPGAGRARRPRPIPP
jgi:hypothetical protein